jgi:NAD(P)-dependent dehydrogenase (short-subunit alcohol dehydrogenase family)
MARNVPLHGLILNAGIMATPLGHTVDGFEQQFGVDHLGHFLLARDLLPRLVESAPARVVVLSSAGHRMGDIDFDDVNFERREYEPFLAYGAAKTCNVLHAVEIDRRYRDRGVRAFAVHPGVIHTELSRYMTEETLTSLITRLSERPTAMAWKSPEQGAATSVWAATSALLDGRGGEYCEDCNVSAVVPDDELDDGGVAARAVDPARASALWALSEKLVG